MIVLGNVAYENLGQLAYDIFRSISKDSLGWKDLTEEQKTFWLNICSYKTLAKNLYIKYVQQLNGVDAEGRPLTQWDNLEKHQKEVWFQQANNTVLMYQCNPELFCQEIVQRIVQLIERTCT